jgi:hypothetical protein
VKRELGKNDQRPGFITHHVSLFTIFREVGRDSVEPFLAEDPQLECQLPAGE